MALLPRLAQIWMGQDEEEEESEEEESEEEMGEVELAAPPVAAAPAEQRKDGDLDVDGLLRATDQQQHAAAGSASKHMPLLNAGESSGAWGDDLHGS